MAEKTRAELGLDVEKPKPAPQYSEEDEKDFKNDPHPNTLRQKDWNDRHRGPTY